MSNSSKDIIFNSQIGHKATVERTQMGKEKAAIPNRMLVDTGLKIQETDDYLKHHHYMGSAAVHIYYNDILQQISFVSQVDGLTLYKCPEPLAAKAFDDLVHTMKAHYGHRRGRLRSGF